LEDKILTVIINILPIMASTLLGTVLGWWLAKRRVKLVFELGYDTDTDEKTVETGTGIKTRESGKCIYCYNIGQAPYLYSGLTLMYKNKVIFDTETLTTKIILPDKHFIQILENQDYNNLIHFCKTTKKRKCTIKAYSIDGKNVKKSELDLYIPFSEAEIDNDFKINGKIEKV
jgi:hypothetical protein